MESSAEEFPLFILLDATIVIVVDEEGEEVIVLPYTHWLEGGQSRAHNSIYFDKSEIQNTSNCAGGRINEYEVIVRSSK